MNVKKGIDTMNVKEEKINKYKQTSMNKSTTKKKDKPNGVIFLPLPMQQGKTRNHEILILDTFLSEEP